jgi:hypothetical protein
MTTAGQRDPLLCVYYNQEPVVSFLENASTETVHLLLNSHTSFLSFHCSTRIFFFWNNAILGFYISTSFRASGYPFLDFILIASRHKFTFLNTSAIGTLV